MPCIAIKKLSVEAYVAEKWKKKSFAVHGYSASMFDDVQLVTYWSAMTDFIMAGTLGNSD